MKTVPETGDSQPKPKNAANNPQDLGETRKDPPLRPQSGAPSDTLILGFPPPESREDTYLLFLVLCYSSPRTLMQKARVSSRLCRLEYLEKSRVMLPGGHMVGVLVVVGVCAHMYTCMCARMCVHMHVWVHARADMYMCMCVHM